MSQNEITAQELTFTTRDGVALRGHFWPRNGQAANGRVMINPATGVLARYYHRYAQFLNEHGFDVFTYDYRGIGLSRPEQLKGVRWRWSDWGTHDFDAAIECLDGLSQDGPLLVVGHSIGGFLPGFGHNCHKVARILTMGAQYAYWLDYAASQRLALFLKWHVAMPALTLGLGYFPGKRLGWLEDLPKGVAMDWSLRGPRMEMAHPSEDRAEVLNNFAKVRAPILCVGMSDDPLGTQAALQRALNYYVNAPRQRVLLTPNDFGLKSIGHFSLFHSRHRDDFWADSVQWLRDGVNPWPGRIADERNQSNSSNRR